MQEIHSFLLIGQSNMAGRADKDKIPVDEICNRIMVARMGGWRAFQRPVNPDNVKSGYCLAESFAVEYLKNCGRKEIYVGLIPCAYGGSGIREWQKGSPNYENAIVCAKNAMKTSTICGILWHQGEQDADYKILADEYSEKLRIMIKNLRDDLNLPDVPFIAGGLGDFLAKRFPKSKFANQVNEALEKARNTIPNYSFVSSAKLEDIGDNLHFDATSLYEFGIRYYDAFCTIADPKRICPVLPTYLELYRNLTTDEALLENDYT